MLLLFGCEHPKSSSMIWRRRRDSNSRTSFPISTFPMWCNRPLYHVSIILTDTLQTGSASRHDSPVVQRALSRRRYSLDPRLPKLIRQCELSSNSPSPTSLTRSRVSSGYLEAALPTELHAHTDAVGLEPTTCFSFHHVGTEAAIISHSKFFLSDSHSVQIRPTVLF